MKIIIVLAIALSSYSASAQQTLQDTIPKSIDLRMNAAGETLQKGSSQLITGMLMSIAGSVLIVAGSQDQKPLTYIGGGLCMIGVGFTFSGFGKVGKAGRQLQYTNKY